MIEKDLAAGLLAKEIDADVLMMLTNVDHVSINYGTPEETALSNITLDEAKHYVSEGQFEASSMLPKVEASIDFLMMDVTAELSLPP